MRRHDKDKEKDKDSGGDSDLVTVGKVSETPVVESVCYGDIPSSLSLKVIELIESPTPPPLSIYFFAEKTTLRKFCN